MTDINNIKNAVKLETLIDQQYPLKGKPGSKYQTTKEHDSLVINTHEQVYYWNSRGEHGDVIDWVGRHCLSYNGTWNSADPNMFKEAICHLAGLAGLPEPQFNAKDATARSEQRDKDRLTKQAAVYYQQLYGQNLAVQNYTTSRGISLDTAQKAGLGYSDGKLWQHISSKDHSTAAKLGLIYQNDKKQWKDAIWANHLVYIHQEKGQVEYLAGRGIGGKKTHCNQRAAKRLYWCTWSGYKGAIIICEGQADALSIAQLGYNAVALCGVNLANLDTAILKLFDTIYYWPDKDDNSGLTNKLAVAIDPLYRIISTPKIFWFDRSPLKDANDLLKFGAKSEDVERWLKSAFTFLETEIELVNNLSAANYDRGIESLFTHLVNLDAFKLTRYRSKICKKLAISHSDFTRLLRAAKGIQEEDEEQFARGGQYAIMDGWTVLKSKTDDRLEIKPLANGSATIQEVIVKDDGSNEPEIHLSITGQLATGRKMPTITCPAADYASISWVHKWSPEFIIQAGRAVQDHFRVATQYLSGTPNRRTIYTHTGWRQINGEWAYLTSSGALGITDKSVQVDLTMGRPDTNITRYNLPLAPANIQQAVEASLNFWNICDYRVTIPIWAAMFLAPLTEFITADFGLWLHGQSGSMKSSMVAICLAHFGDWQGQNSKTLLPANFGSTANSILMNAFQVKNAVLVIDDFAPGSTASEVKERDTTASKLLRSLGNKAARGRMRDGRHFQADFPPRCLALITAEDLPHSQSIMARGVGVRVFLPPRGLPARKAIEKRLDKAQTSTSYLYPHAMSGFILWVKRHWNELATDLPKMAADYRSEIQSKSHSRLPDAFGKLMAATSTMLLYAMDCGALTSSQAEDMKLTAYQAINEALSEHSDAVDSVDACFLFREILQGYIDAKLWHLRGTKFDDFLPDNLPIGSKLIGYQDEEYIYLLTHFIPEIIDTHKRTGTPFPVGRNTLYQRLAERGWLIKQNGKATQPTHIPAHGGAARVIKLKKSDFFAEIE